MKNLRITRTIAIVLLLAAIAASASAGGVLTPTGSPDQPIRIVDHQVRVVINNGFARTEVSQTFFNPNAVDLEAVYSFPVPRSAALSEVTIFIGEIELHGEVLTEDEADRIYGEQRDEGNDAGLASKSEFEDFEFRVSPVRANAETRLRFVYYQPIEIDTGVGRYVYPLESGGTDVAGASFWMRNKKVDATFSVDIELKSAYPVDEVRVPGFDGAVIDQLDAGHYTVHVESENGSLDRDIVFYYRLEDNLPGRVDLLCYRDDPTAAGTFMLIVTPGLDLQPLTQGADYCFVLDVSGSMSGAKIKTLADGVARGLGRLKPEDRFRVITFNGRARVVTSNGDGGWLSATEDNVDVTLRKVAALRPTGGTNMYEGLWAALDSLDPERATSIVLITDAVTNTGVIDPRAFHELLKQYDVRLFGFLLGNNANWPLMRMICETTGGFWKRVSNSDDLIGQILLARSKITHESLHDARLTIDGVKSVDATDRIIGKVYRGQQLVIFGRYEQPGPARVSLHASLTGEDKTYTTTIDFPEIDLDHPELERLWAMDRIDEVVTLGQTGYLSAAEAQEVIESLGVEFQLVTDHTSMVVLPDEVFAQYGIERLNQQRVAREVQAQQRTAAQSPRQTRMDRGQPMFEHASPAPGGTGGGAVTPFGLALLAAPLAMVLNRRKRSCI